MSRLFKPAILIPTAFNALFVTTSTLHVRSRLAHNLEEQEARLDEIEGTFRGHIGLIEDTLDRLENKPNDANKQQDLYGKRAQHGKD